MSIKDRAAALVAELVGYDVPMFDSDQALIEERLSADDGTTFIRVGHNEYGTPIDLFWCKDCGHAFTLCPALDDRSRDHVWTGCLGKTCTSYDPDRDVDRFFDDGDTLSIEARKNPDVITRKPLNWEGVVDFEEWKRKALDALGTPTPPAGGQ